MHVLDAILLDENAVLWIASAGLFSVFFLQSADNSWRAAMSDILSALDFTKIGASL